MKRFIFVFPILMLPVLAFGTTVSADVEPIVPGETIEYAEAMTLTDSLKALKAVDRSSLTRVERRQLRKDIRNVNNQMNIDNSSDNGGGLFVSLGPLVVVIVLLIIFL